MAILSLTFIKWRTIYQKSEPVVDVETNVLHHQDKVPLWHNIYDTYAVSLQSWLLKPVKDLGTMMGPVKSSYCKALYPNIALLLTEEYADLMFFLSNNSDEKT